MVSYLEVASLKCRKQSQNPNHLTGQLTSKSKDLVEVVCYVLNNQFIYFIMYIVHNGTFQLQTRNKRIKQNTLVNSKYISKFELGLSSAYKFNHVLKLFRANYVVR